MKPELLSPAGDFEKLQMAIAYGADAVYMGGKTMSLRAGSKNFEDDELKRAMDYARSKKVKAYITVNIFAHNKDFEYMEDYLHHLKEIGADAVIVSDLGVFNIARKIGLEIHISTQANVTNLQSLLLYKELGASRVILARELSFAEITCITREAQPFETEVFVHGAMCMAYSGRCLLSKYMVNRDANQGDCAQPCRWQYTLSEKPSDKNPHPSPMDIYQDERGTYILNSKDLCMIEFIPELVASGVSSLKIEGRMKSAYYVAIVTNAYRKALDDFFEYPEKYHANKDYYLRELQKTNNREFSTGFYLDKATEGQLTHKEAAITHDFVGLVLDYNKENSVATIEQRNKFVTGDMVEFVKGGFSQQIEEIYTEKGESVTTAPHPQQILYIKTTMPVEKFEIMRKVGLHL